MRRSGTSPRDSAVTWACVVAVHVVLIWTGARLLRAEAPRHAPAMELVFIEATPIKAPESITTSSTPGRTRMLSRPDAPRPRAWNATSRASADDAPALPVGRSMTAVFIAQAGQQGTASAPPPPPTDPFADRPVHLPGEARVTRLHVRMREPRSVARVVDGIGALFGGPGPDPCAEARANIAALGPGDDRAALEREVDFERRDCRP